MSNKWQRQFVMKADLGRHLEEEIQDGSGEWEAGASVGFGGRFVGEKVRRSEGGICHSARGIMSYLMITGS